MNNVNFKDYLNTQLQGSEFKENLMTRLMN